jgi:hypothetical protein
MSEEKKQELSLGQTKGTFLMMDSFLCIAALRYQRGDGRTSGKALDRKQVQV